MQAGRFGHVTSPLLGPPANYLPEEQIRMTSYFKESNTKVGITARWSSYLFWVLK